MNSLQITLDTGAVYHLLGIIQGTVTTGVTLTPTGGTRPGQTANVSRLILQGDPTNAGANVAYGDKGIATDGSTGKILQAGDVDMYQGQPCPTLNFYVAVSASGAILQVNWD